MTAHKNLDPLDLGVGWTDSPTTILPTITQLIDNGISVWIYSGDTDGRIPVTASRYSVNKLKLPVETAWRPWYFNREGKLPPSLT
ncbi:hypothetical protein L2E82_17453 [Cichorium intybus]|uniref:Uncharacterized protein n=1 Tax=Cichorium intybus TaxID=13427 RepID=A0ACB9F989_CICIN|nr:hypothetical protein L2E82_17453 [Cichorium intybus]